METTKKFYLSKTFWLNAIAIFTVVLGGQSPVISEFLKQYFTELGSGWAVLNIILRIVSKDKLAIS